MEEKSVFNRVVGIVHQQIGDDREITREMKFKYDLGFDSLDVIEMTIEIEEDFDIDIPRDADEKILTVGALVDYITNSPPIEKV